jgi:erythronate-4-phosphate dehydrogenase
MKIVADGNIPFVEACFSHLGEIQVVQGRQITPATVADAEVLLVRSVTRVDRRLLEGSRVRFVATATIGFEHVDVDYLRSRGIGFASAPGSNANSVAEYIVAALLAVGRKHEILLDGKSIGIVGVGNVGSRVATKCRALGLRTVLNDPPLARKIGDPKYRPLEEVLGCDFVTFHTPLTKDGPDRTFHLADRTFFERLKPGTVFLNTSRGAVHDTAALKVVMAQGRLRAVVLDVWENEPNIDQDLLRKVDISTPHIAGYSFDGKVAGMIMIYQAVCRHLGVLPIHEVAEFLPAPAVPTIDLAAGDVPEQESLHQIVQQVYPIHRDDFNTREILMVPAQARGAFFDDLRKNYPVRREFQNTTVLMGDPESPMGRKLAGIGFQWSKKQRQEVRSKKQEVR